MSPLVLFIIAAVIVVLAITGKSFLDSIDD